MTVKLDQLCGSAAGIVTGESRCNPCAPSDPPWQFAPLAKLLITPRQAFVGSGLVRLARSALIWLAPLLSLTLLVACQVTLIGDYDDTIDKGITDIQQRTELYFSRLRSTPDTPYDQTFYDDINSRLIVLKSRAVSLSKYAIITEQLQNMQRQFDDLQKLDKGSSRPISAGIVTAADTAMA